MSAVGTVQVSAPTAPPRWRVVRRLRRSWVGMVSTGVLVLLVVVAVLAPWLAPQDPNIQDLVHRNEGPTWAHLLGTDALGRDTLSRLIVAARVTLLAAAEASGLAVLIGTPAGLYAGYLGGWLDSLLSRLADALLCLPPLILAMAIVGILGPGLTNAMVALGIVFAPRFFRLARSLSRSITAETYIEAERALGASTKRIAFVHVLPNASSALLVQISFTFGFIITAEATLSFLGLGVQAPQASWGGMVREAFNNIRRAVFPVIPPAAMIVIAILALSLFGDSLRDAMGRQQRRGS